MVLYFLWYSAYLVGAWDKDIFHPESQAEGPGETYDPGAVIAIALTTLTTITCNLMFGESPSQLQKVLDRSGNSNWSVKCAKKIFEKMQLKHVKSNIIYNIIIY